ncbi:nucleoside deaminase [Arthrobacter sp. H14-L1]|uniref:nucleoside deaminase n=1 Tax=Arthrobacter sp. H14-L1 TaxID=2996697 RepID=UPI00226EB5F1|nr:nucleoside deaminase [Arthrobacter sp. H14-L1]MCY0903429.1 nucleoside deaminase [Arthrobacter sp. H14-L1]
MDTEDSPVTPESRFVQRSVDLAHENVDAGGKPFACLLVHQGKVAIEATNQVAQTGDVTAHAEIQALRLAAEQGLRDLSEYDVYITAHPCPMCLGALYYAAPRAVIYAASREAEAEHYEDGNKYMSLSTFYDEFPKDPADRALPMHHGLLPDPASPFRYYAQKNG